MNGISSHTSKFNLCTANTKYGTPILLFDYVFLFANIARTILARIHISFRAIFIYKWWNSIKKNKLKTNQVRFPLWLKYTFFFLLLLICSVDLINIFFFCFWNVVLCKPCDTKRIYRWMKCCCVPAYKNMFAISYERG